MIKNYSDYSFGEKMKTNHLQPKKETVSFLLNYSKSLTYCKGTIIDEIRFDKN